MVNFFLLASTPTGLLGAAKQPDFSLSAAALAKCGHESVRLTLGLHFFSLALGGWCRASDLPGVSNEITARQSYIPVGHGLWPWSLHVSSPVRN